MQINLSKYPSLRKTYVADLPKLSGGLNIWELDYRISAEQSPCVKNLWWQDGAVQCRNGQSYISSSTAYGTGYACAPNLFWDMAFFHIGTKLYYGDPTGTEIVLSDLGVTVPQNKGTFFRYGDYLFYKNNGGFFRIAYTPSSNTMFTCVDVVSNAYTPVILMNTDPTTHAGDLYQPENRLSSKKTIWYNAKSGITEYNLPVSVDSIVSVFVDGVETSAYTLNAEKNKITFNTAPPVTDPETNNTVRITYSKTDKTDATETKVSDGTTTVYQIGKKTCTGLVSIDSVKVDNVSAPYVADMAAGTITLSTAPTIYSHVVIEYKYNATLNSVMTCPYAMVAGADIDLCILLGGCESQPNAVFWNSNDDVSMNSSYWPVEYYNLVDDTEDPVTGFGKQYKDTIVFKAHSICKFEYSTVDVKGRTNISFTYQSINNKTGCDLPWSIQLIENNLVFCNTYQGVHYIQSTSAAYENNVVGISKNVNGSQNVGAKVQEIKGLLYDVRNSEDVVTSFDDDYRYWICANGKVYLWDYSLSTASDPAWFYFTDIHGVSYFADDEHRSYHLNSSGQITRMVRNFSDYGSGIDKVYQFPVMYFDTYDKLKDILYVIFSIRADTESVVTARYDCDYDQRVDPVSLMTWDWVGIPFNLNKTIVGYYNLTAPSYARIAKRRPGFFHVRHFSFRLSNNVAGQDLAIIAAKTYYRFSEKER